MFAELLTQIQPRSVNETGLGAVYDFSLSWDETAGPYLVTALQEQLGLRFGRPIYANRHSMTEA